MATTTVRLDDDDEALLDLLAADYGGRSGAIRHALRALAAERMRRRALADLLAAWDDGPGVTDDEVDELTRRFGL